MASGSRPVEAAAVVGVSNRTLRRWRKDPEFLALVERYAAEAGDHGDHADRLIETLTRAIEVNPAKVLAAATALLTRLLSRREAVRSAENGGGELLDKLFSGEATAADLDGLEVSEAQRTAYEIRPLDAGVYYLVNKAACSCCPGEYGPLLAALEEAREAAAADSAE